MTLYSYFRSSAAFRVRIALNLKGIAYQTLPIHLIKDGGRHRQAEYRAVNPHMRVPALVAPGGEVLFQSLAIIEYLDEIAPEPPLLPKDPISRAHVRAMADIVAADAAGKVDEAIAVDVLNHGAFGARGKNGSGVVDAARDGFTTALHQGTRFGSGNCGTQLDSSHFNTFLST